MLIFSLIMLLVSVICIVIFTIRMVVEDGSKAVFYILLDIIFCLNIILSINAVHAFNRGYLLTDINGGIYDIAFIYPAGGNVTVGINKVWNKDEKEGLRVFCFPKVAFSGDVRRDAKKIEVIVGGKNFKRINLY